MTQTVSILAIDDDPDHLELLGLTVSRLSRITVQLEKESDPGRALPRILDRRHDVYLIDYDLGPLNGLDIVAEAAEADHRGPFILLTSMRQDDLDIESVRAGAVDYLPKDEMKAETLERSLLLAIERSRALESERRAAEAAKAALEAKGEFLATITHELRTPLANVIGLAQIMLDPIEGVPEEERRAMLGRIVDEGHELAGLVEDLLASARSELGRLHVVSVDVDVRAQARQVLETLSAERRSRVSEDLAASSALADPRRIRQVFRNLLDNALKYGGDQIVVRTATENGAALLEVRDDGPGLGDTADRVFERHNADTSVAASNGIGLSLANELAQLMGGSLGYDRSDGWTRFSLRLPAVER